MLECIAYVHTPIILWSRGDPSGRVQVVATHCRDIHRAVSILDIATRYTSGYVITPDASRCLIQIGITGLRPHVHCFELEAGEELWEHRYARRYGDLIAGTSNTVAFLQSEKGVVSRINITDAEVISSRAGIVDCFDGMEGIVCMTKAIGSNQQCYVIAADTDRIIEVHDTTPYTLWRGLASEDWLIGADGMHRGLHCYDASGHRWSVPTPHRGDPCRHVSVYNGRVYYSTRYTGEFIDTETLMRMSREERKARRLERDDIDVLNVLELDLETGERLRSIQVPTALGWYPYDGGGKAISTLGILDYTSMTVTPHDYSAFDWL